MVLLQPAVLKQCHISPVNLEPLCTSIVSPPLSAFKRPCISESRVSSTDCDSEFIRMVQLIEKSWSSSRMRMCMHIRPNQYTDTSLVEAPSPTHGFFVVLFFSRTMIVR